jgi:glycosyltransferase involved in cell wall biosynthesis
MQSPPVSVIVPLYNKAPYVLRCLNSILTQSFSDFELIVVDDGSTDDGPDRVRESRDPRVRILTQTNSGPGAARNKGIGEARGALVAMLDADDAWEPDYLEKSVARMNGYGPEVMSVTWGVREFPKDLSSEKRWERLGIPEGPYRLTPETPARLLDALVCAMFPSATVVRREALERLGGFYARNRCLYAEDVYLWLKLLMGDTAAYHREPLVHRHLDASDLTNPVGVRPVEPFLLDSAALRKQCPATLRPVLESFLTLRACKTASVYGYFGHHLQARKIMQEFVSWKDWGTPLFALGWVGCTPVAAWLGRLARLARLNLRAS